VVQAFPAYRADQALRIPVLPRRTCGSRMIANAKRANSADEYSAVASVPIVDQVTRDLLPVVPKNHVRTDSCDEENQRMIRTRCVRSSICLGPVSAIYSSRGAGFKSRISFSDISSI